MTTEPLWRGIGVALLTVFDDTGGIDAKATGAHAARLVEAGVRAVLVNGTTAEAAALTDEERVALVSAVREACPGVPVLAGASGEWHGQAAKRVREAAGAGADAVLVAPPRFGGDLGEYYEKAAGSKPVLAYHYPGVAGGAVPIEQLPQWPVAGVKDSSGDVTRLAEMLTSGWEGAIYTGSSALIMTGASLGITGAILGAANLVPRECGSAWEGDVNAQRAVIRAEREAKTSAGGLKAAAGLPAYRRLG
jgi:4-hydroxy-tetrahydrodipicolinate synthase